MLLAYFLRTVILLKFLLSISVFNLLGIKFSILRIYENFMLYWGVNFERDWKLHFSSFILLILFLGPKSNLQTYVFVGIFSVEPDLICETEFLCLRCTEVSFIFENSAVAQISHNTSQTADSPSLDTTKNCT